MKLEGKRGEWWIVGVPVYHHHRRDGTVVAYDRYGPYTHETRDEVEKIRKGLEATIEDLAEAEAERESEKCED